MNREHEQGHVANVRSDQPDEHKCDPDNSPMHRSLVVNFQRFECLSSGKNQVKREEDESIT